MKQTCIKLNQCLKQEGLPFVDQHHDLFGAAQAAGPQQQAQDAGDLSKSESEKLFELISLEEFIDLCRKEKLIGMEEFFHKNDIQVQTFVL